MPRCFVINLNRRPDRLDRFVKEFGAHFEINRCAAIDADDIVITPQLRSRCNDWAFIHAPDRVKKILGCCLSHMWLWKHIGSLSDPYVFVFEDDCAFINDDVHDNFTRYFDSLQLPPDFGILWLNGTIEDSPGTPVTGDFELKEYQLHNTTEAYVVTPSYALELYSYVETQMGAVDIFMERYTRSTPGRSFRIFPPFFCQSDRQDTDIQR
jgi:hypothetical protein